MREFLSNVFLGITLIVMIVGAIGCLFPRLLRMRSRLAVLGWAVAVFGLSAILGTAFQTNFQAGAIAFSNEDWSTAVERLSNVSPIDTRYDSAQTLIASSHRRIELQSTRRNASTRYVHTNANLRSGPGTDRPISRTVDPDETLLVAPSARGWALVYGRWTGTHVDTAGYISEKLLRTSKYIRPDPPEAVASHAPLTESSRERGSSAAAWVACKRAVRDQLQSPRSANFPWSDYKAIEGDPGTWAVSSYVDAKNPLGVEIRSYFICKVVFGRDALMPDYIDVAFER